MATIGIDPKNFTIIDISGQKRNLQQQDLRLTVKFDASISLQLLNQLQKHILNTPSVLICIWIPNKIEIAKLLKQKLVENGYPQQIANNLDMISNFCDWNSKVVNVCEELEGFFKENKEIIEEIYKDFIKYNNINEEQKTSAKKQGLTKSEILSCEISNLLKAFNEYVTLDDTYIEVYLSQKGYLSLSPFQNKSLSSTVVPSQNTQILCVHKILKDLLINRKEQHADLALQILVLWEQLLKQGQKGFVEHSKFTTKVYKIFVIKNKINQTNVERALALLQLSFNQNELQQLKQKKQNENKRKKQRQKYKKAYDNMIVQCKAIEIISDEEGDIIIKEEFKNMLQTNYQIPSISSDSTSMTQSESLESLPESVFSFLTVHSRAQPQQKNQHWKQRYLERGKSITENDWEKLLGLLKEALLKKRDIFQSTKDPKRWMVRGLDGLQFIIAYNGKTDNGKDLYVPVTVLSAQMSFE